MKTFTVYLDTRTGRSQVSFEAERFELTDRGIEFFRNDIRVAFFLNATCFGVMEESHGAAWEEEPPTAAV